MPINWIYKLKNPSLSLYKHAYTHITNENNKFIFYHPILHVKLGLWTKIKAQVVWKTFYRNKICKSSFYMAFLFVCLIEIIFSGLTKVCFTTKQTPKYAENVFQENILYPSKWSLKMHKFLSKVKSAFKQLVHLYSVLCILHGDM